jgi:hypothetical protein
VSLTTDAFWREGANLVREQERSPGGQNGFHMMVCRLAQGMLLLPGIQNQPRKNPRHFPSKFRLRQSSPRSPNRSPPWTHLLSLAQVCSPMAQATAATVQVQRRKWKMFMSRFRRRNHCYITRVSTLLDLAASA